MVFEDVTNKPVSKFADMLDGEVKHEFMITGLVKDYTQIRKKSQKSVADWDPNIDV